MASARARRSCCIYLQHVCFLVICTIFRPTTGLKWTYQQKPWNTEALPTQSYIPLAFSSDENVDLQAQSYGCSIKNKLSGTAGLVCNYPGIHTMTATQSGLQSKRFLNFESVPHCYTWNVVRARNKIMEVKPWDNFTTYIYGYSVETLNIWIGEPVNDTQSGALKPSPELIKLNQHFHKKGQVPTLQPILNYPFTTNVKPATFHEDSGMWSVDVHKTGTAIIRGYRVEGHPVSFHHCTAPDADVLMWGPDVEVHGTPQTSPGQARGTDLFEIFQDKKYPNTFIFMESGRISITTDAFRSHGVFHIYSKEHYQIKSLSFSDHSVVTLSTTGKVFVGTLVRNRGYADYIRTVTYDQHGIIVGVDTYSGPTKQKLEQTEAGLDLWLLWTKNQLHHCEVGICNQVQNLDKHFRAAGFEAGSVPPNTEFCYVAAAICDGMFKGDFAAAFACVDPQGDRKFVFGRYNSKQETWRMVAINLVYNATQSYKISFVKKHNIYLFWSSVDIFYVSSDGAAKVDVLQGTIHKNITEAIDANEKVMEIASYGGKIVVLSSQNSLFYGHASMPHIIKLEQWLEKTDKAHIWFDELGRLHLTASGQSGIKDIVYPLALEVNSVLHGMDHPLCPYLNFKVDNSIEEKTIDLNEKVTVGSQLSSLVENGVSLQFYNTAPKSVVNMNSAESTLFGRKLSEQEVQLSFRHGNYGGNPNYEDYKTFLEHSSETAFVTFKPSNQSLFCKDPTVHISSVSGGCPANKRIAIKRDKQGCEFFGKFSVIRNSQNATRTDTYPEVEERYQWDTWGCPVMVNIEENYIPQLVFMDGETEIGPVTQNFVIYEIFNQSIEYTATAGQVRCLRPAQNWQQMAKAYLALDPSADLNETETRDKIWGPWNYKSCFEREPAPVGDHQDENQGLSVPYEILNRTGLSALNFRKDRNHVYVLRATVVDPNESFCILQTEFAVHTFGAVVQPKVVVTYAATIGTFLVICLSFLGALYFVFMKYYSPKYEEEED